MIMNAIRSCWTLTFLVRSSMRNLLETGVAATRVIINYSNSKASFARDPLRWWYWILESFYSYIVLSLSLFFPRSYILQSSKERPTLWQWTLPAQELINPYPECSSVYISTDLTYLSPLTQSGIRIIFNSINSKSLSSPHQQFFPDTVIEPISIISLCWADASRAHHSSKHIHAEERTNLHRCSCFFFPSPFHPLIELPIQQ